MRESGEHLLGLVSEVLDYARLDAGRLELEEAPVDVERLVRGVCELLSPRAHAGGVEIAWGMEGHVPPVLADDGRLRQILFNLAGNAVKLTRSGGVLVTARARRVSRGGVRLRLAVRDTGPGLALEQQARVFDEFEQDEAGARAGGAGLGLAIVRRLADAFGGELVVQSRAGEGALFAFEADFAGRRAVPRDDMADLALDGVAVALVSSCPVVTAAAAMQVAAAGGRPVVAAPGGADPAARGRAAGGRRRRPRPGAHRRAEPDPPGSGGAGADRRRPRRRLCGLSDQAAAAGLGGRAHPRGPGRRGERALPTTSAPPPPPRPAHGCCWPRTTPSTRCSRARSWSARDARWSAPPRARRRARPPRRSHFDLILMDLRMPGMDGLAAARTIRALGVAAPIVALTANAFEDDRRACREAGMDDFLTKPMDAGALRGGAGALDGREAESERGGLATSPSLSPGGGG